MKGKNRAARVERLALEGLGVMSISKATGVHSSIVVEILGASPAWREYRERCAERRQQHADARRRLLLRDIARAQGLMLLPDCRDARGRIDWPSVRGYLDERSMIREAVEAEIAGRRTP